MQSTATWTRLIREQAHEVLNKLSGHKDAIVFSKEATEVAWRSLPFYTHQRLYRLTNYATMPTFSMTYLSDGHSFTALDGTAIPIYAVNDKDPIRLNEMNVIPYLEFFFGNVQGSEGELYLIKDLKRMPFFENLTAPQQQSAFGSFKPLKATYDAAAHQYKITGTLYYGGSLIATQIVVTAEGRISFLEQNMLLSGIYFPHTPYGQSWAEA